MNLRYSIVPPALPINLHMFPISSISQSGYIAIIDSGDGYNN